MESIESILPHFEIVVKEEPCFSEQTVGQSENKSKDNSESCSKKPKMEMDCLLNEDPSCSNSLWPMVKLENDEIQQHNVAEYDDANISSSGSRKVATHKDYQVVTVIDGSQNNTSIKSLPVEFITSNNTIVTTCAESDSALTRKKKKESKFFHFDLRKVLNDHPIGKELLLIANKKNISLETAWISHLCEIIVIHCLKENLTLINKDFEELAAKIVDLFPAECIQTFYVPPVKKKNSLRQLSEISKGKLVDKYRNILTTIRTLRKVADVYNDRMEKDEKLDNNIKDPAQQSKEWLKHHRDEVNVILHWKLSYQLRRTEVSSNKYSSATDILNDWPILKESVCAELINTDFEQTYHCRVGNISQCWNKIFLQLKNDFYNKLNTEHQEKLNLLEASNEEVSLLSKNIIQLQIFLNILAPKLRKKNKNTYDERQAQQDAFKSICMHVKIPGDIDNACALKVSTEAKTKIPILPYLILVGPNVLDLKKIYIQVDNHRLEASTFAEGFDLLFKFYLLFKLAYPEESHHFWYFIQWGMYNIKTESDVQLPSIFSILHKLKINLPLN